MPATSSLPPGPRLPRAAQTLRWIVRPTVFMDEQARRFGDCFTVRLLNSPPMVFVSDPASVRAVFTGDPDVLRAGVANQILEPVLGANSVLLLDGERHLRQRRLILPAFHGERMQRYEAVMVAAAKEEIARWPLDQPFALLPRMQAVTLEVILRAVFGLREGERLDRLRVLLRELLEWTAGRDRLLRIALLGPTRFGERSLAPLRAALRPVHALLDEELTARRRQAGGNGAAPGRDDVLTLLLEARDEDGEPLDDAELRDELITLLVAGHETTATALAWAMERLLRHPQALGRLREELAGGEEAYLDAVVKETLRLRPILPIVARYLTAPFELHGRLLPAGTEIAPCIYLAHRNPEVYPDPLAFRPERFLEQPAGTYSWIPFGGGVRRCLGASFAQFELRSVLRAIVLGTELRAADAAAERVVRRAITYMPRRGAEVVLDRRPSLA
jgi:cytochrome P450